MYQSIYQYHVVNREQYIYKTCSAHFSLYTIFEPFRFFPIHMWSLYNQREPFQVSYSLLSLPWTNAVPRSHESMVLVSRTMPNNAVASQCSDSVWWFRCMDDLCVLDMINFRDARTFFGIECKCCFLCLLSTVQCSSYIYITSLLACSSMSLLNFPREVCDQVWGPFVCSN